jgi:uroporphyrinogen III methyltransferase/synthase
VNGPATGSGRRPGTVNDRTGRLGTVYLVGAGPGDPGLLTVRGRRLLRRADVVIYDRLIDPRLLECTPRSAERIDVGKRSGTHTISQEAINRLLIDAASRAAVVVRLKGGDPFIFGRGGEEALALAESGVRFEVVPGVTAGIGAAAYAGIPLTHRSTSSTVTFVTGHEDVCRAESRIAWDEIARAHGTIAIYMGAGQLREIAQRLIAHGRAPDTPAAVIEWGTYAHQRTVTAPLSAIADRAEEAGLEAPAMIVVGEVVALRNRLSWFERRPLFGLRVLLPRSRPQRSRLASGLTRLGGNVHEFPRLRVLPAPAPEPLRHAVAAIGSYGWIAFTDVAAVSHFWHEWSRAGGDARGLAALRFACFGTATAAALERHGIRAEVALATYDPDAAATALLARQTADAAGAVLAGPADTAVADETAPRELGRVLFCHGAGGRSAIAERLTHSCFRVDRVEAYRTAIDLEGVAELRRALDDAEVDVVVFSSSGTVREFVDALGADTGSATVAAMGAETARVALSYGLPVHVVPQQPSIHHLVNGIVEHATSKRTGRGARAAAGGTRVAARP